MFAETSKNMGAYGTGGTLPKGLKVYNSNNARAKAQAAGALQSGNVVKAFRMSRREENAIFGTIKVPRQLSSVPF